VSTPRQNFVLFLLATAAIALGVAVAIVSRQRAKMARVADGPPVVSSPTGAGDDATSIDPGSALDDAVARSLDARSIEALRAPTVNGEFPGGAPPDHPVLSLLWRHPEHAAEFATSLMRHLEDSRKTVRLTVLAGLVALGKAAAGAIPALLAATRDDDEEIASTALLALASAAKGDGEAAGDVVRAIVTSPLDFSAEEKGRSVARLAYAHRDDPDAMPGIFRAIDPIDDDATRAAILTALQILRGADAARPVARYCAKDLGHSAAIVRVASARTLGWLVTSPYDAEIDAALVHLDGDPDVRSTLLDALDLWSANTERSAQKRVVDRLFGELERGCDDAMKVYLVLGGFELDVADVDRLARLAAAASATDAAHRLVAPLALAGAVEAIHRRAGATELVRRLHPFFVDLADHDDEAVSSRAVEVLVIVYDDADATADRLIAQVELESGEERASASELLGRLGADRLGALTDGASAALIEALADAGEDPGVREAVARALPEFPNGATDSVPALVAVLDDASNDASLRRAALVGLARLGEAAAGAVESIARYVDGSDHGISPDEAAIALGSIGPAAASALPQLLSRVRVEIGSGDEDNSFAQSYAEVMVDAIARIGRATPESIDTLLKPFDDDELEPTALPLPAFAAALSRLEPLPAEIGPQLTTILTTSQLVRVRGAFDEDAATMVPVLGELGPDASRVAVRALTATLDGHDDVNHGVAAARALGMTTAEPQARVESLLRAARWSRDAALRVAALRALALVGPAVESHIDDALPCLADGDAFVREAAVELLGELAARPDIVCPRLAAALEDTDPAVRRRAAWALGAFGDAATKQVDSVAARLVDIDARVRWEAARGLGRIGAAAERALPALRKTAADDDDRHVRAAARQAERAISAGGET